MRIDKKVNTKISVKHSFLLKNNKKAGANSEATSSKIFDSTWFDQPSNLRGWRTDNVV